MLGQTEGLWAGESQKVLQRCLHCGEEVNKSVKLCDFCSTAAKRDDMHKENLEAFKQIGIEWRCPACVKRGLWK